MKRMALLAALGVAFGAAAAMAQSPVPVAPQQQQHRAWQSGHRPGNGFGGLLKGINLTDAQKTQLDQLRKNERGAMQRGRNGGQANVRQQIQAARQRGDTAAIRQLIAQARSQMEARRDQQVAALRGILTPDQQAQFDKNVAQLKQRQGRFQGQAQLKNGL